MNNPFPILIICRLPDAHVEAVTTHLREANFEFEVWNLNEPQSAKYALEINSEWCFSYQSIWWRYKGTSREYQGLINPTEAFVTREWLAALRGLAASTTSTLWVNNPVLTVGSNLKIRNLKIAADLGFKIPETLITNSPDQFQSFITRLSSRKIIYKPLTYYYEEPDIAVFTTVIPTDNPLQFKENIQVTPILLQELVEKEYELRITIVGNQIFPVHINSQAFDSTQVDWRRDQTVSELYSPFSLPEHLRVKILNLHEALGLIYGAYDFIMDKSGELVFLEVNPGGQWLWVEQATNLSISLAMAKLLMGSAHL